MGGKTGGNSTLGDTRALEQQAREILSDGLTKKRLVFLSAAAADSAELSRIRADLKKNLPSIDLIERNTNEPIDSPRADYIKQKTREVIVRSTTTIVFLSAAASNDKWVEWEIAKSAELKKPVIGFYSGERPKKLPKSFNSKFVYTLQELFTLLK